MGEPVEVDRDTLELKRLDFARDEAPDPNARSRARCEVIYLRPVILGGGLHFLYWQ